MTRVARAIEKSETQGFMKVVVDTETRKILGAAILGTGGDEAIHGIIDVMNARVSYNVLQWAVPIPHGLGAPPHGARRDGARERRAGGRIEEEGGVDELLGVRDRVHTLLEHGLYAEGWV